MSKWLLFLMIPLLALAGCAGDVAVQDSPPDAVDAAEAPEAVEAVVADEVSGATPDGTGWKVNLVGVRTDAIYQSDFESWKTSSGGYREMDLESKGETHRYGGFLLRDVIAIVDDAAGGMPFVFQEGKWTEGYEITFTAADGFSATINTAEVSSEEVLFADTLDGQAVTPRIAGNITGRAWVRDLAEISLSLAPVDLAANDFTLEFEINGKTQAWTIGDLEAMDIYIEGPGSFTNSYGNTTQSTWGGVKLVPLLSRFMEVTSESSIRVIAMDGYEMTYGGGMLLDQADGDWILAFKENGQYMPEDPGYIRVVKAGPKNPNITGHVSARMVKKIVSEGSPFVDFQLAIVQRDQTEIFDRQTMQSGVTTNRNRVTYFDARSGSDIPYMGISLWRLLERIKGYRAVTIEATDGFRVTLEAAQIEGNDDVIVAMYTGAEDRLLDESDWPLRLVWDKNAAVVPAGIKSVRNISRIVLVY